MPELRNPPPAKAAHRLMKQAAAARALGIARSTVMAKVGAKELESEIVDGTPMIVRASVDAYLARLVATQQEAAAAA